MDLKLKKVRSKYGMEGYGLYWYLLEHIAVNVESHNLTFELEHDAEIIGEDVKISRDLVQEMMVFMVDLGLFENREGTITCLKMATRTDEYTQKLLRDFNFVPTRSLESPDKVPPNRIEENRIEEIQEVFNHWVSVMNKNSGTKLTGDRKRKIKARLNEGFTVSQIKQAVIGCKNSDYHMGQNDQRKLYNDIELICRSGSKVEGFIDIKPEDQEIWH